MSSDALQKAKSEAQKAIRSVSGQYLSNDDLIANQRVFVIVDVVEDRGGGYAGQDRWLVKVEPYYDGEEDLNGLISLSAGSEDKEGNYRDNAARRAFMKSLQATLDDLESKGEDTFIGPAVQVKLKGAGKWRYNEIVPWDDNANNGKGAPIYPEGTTPVGALDEDMRVRRPRAGVPNAEPTAEVVRPSFGEAVEAEAEATAAPEPARLEVVRPAEFPPIKVWARNEGYDVPEGRGRVKTEIKVKYEAARAAWESGKTDERALVSGPRKAYQGVTAEIEQELAAQAAEMAVVRPAEPPKAGPSREQLPPEQGAYTAQETVWKPGMSGTSIEPCPACGQHIHDKAYPYGDAFVLVHTRCPAGAEQMTMPVYLD